ncbi:class I mannose-6-phosphate isomerase [Acidipila rosea]|uniref:Mannose-6-phosphate isomerase class I n=1 Tax=Acidipila rosea TaxID=768535 RepID=A0A4V2PVJ5_9BACT|nr:class I mannose-6-phosphate isomerase [Acidipila rosea]TCK74301.1 mannose-6-phosphate isomerase class I [Acidipila rosea]
MYDKYPEIQVSDSSARCMAGWDSITAELQRAALGRRCVLCVECYPGVFVPELCAALKTALNPALFINVEELLLPPASIQERVQPWLTDDPVFGRLTTLTIADFLDSQKVEFARAAILQQDSGLVIVAGAGAAFVAENYDLLVYADMARWEIQQRQRRGQIGNLGADNCNERPSLKYKRSFFVDWRVADRIKQELFSSIDYLLDTNSPQTPKMIPGDLLHRGLMLASRRPFRVVPFFDPGPWGGHWMERTFALPADVPNYAWCFDCVPEENSLLLAFGELKVEIPAINLVFTHPRELLGQDIYRRFGAEFPIRFDFLDTIEGGNLSLQVHPLTEYIRQAFGQSYTQDESYYILDAERDASVYLGLKEEVDADAMQHDLAAAQAGDAAFDAERYVNRFPARRHDHFLIPAGTVHCSGRGSMVLEISATPYIFTFKLWDWGRLGLDGRPRPIHLKHGIANIQWDRTTDWVKRSLINRVEPVAEGDGWREERTGLHELQFIETRRHWFTGSVPHDTGNTVNVLNLIEGEQIVVESPDGAFEPFTVHYAETFIVPAQVGLYTIRPSGPSEGKKCATIKAFIRPEHASA